MARTFASKLLDYCIGDISKARLTNCYKMIAENQNGQYTVLKLLDYFMELFGEIVNYEIKRDNSTQQG